MKRQNYTEWYFFGILGCLLLMCGLLYGVLISPYWAIAAVIGIIICGFVAWNFPNNRKD